MFDFLYHPFDFHVIVKMWYKILPSSGLERHGGKLRARISMKSVSVWTAKPHAVSSPSHWDLYLCSNHPYLFLFGLCSPQVYYKVKNQPRAANPAGELQCAIIFPWGRSCRATAPSGPPLHRFPSLFRLLPMLLVWASLQFLLWF